MSALVKLNVYSIKDNLITAFEMQKAGFYARRRPGSGLATGPLAEVRAWARRGPNMR
jgi:hypothetical protein